MWRSLIFLLAIPVLAQSPISDMPVGIETLKYDVIVWRDTVTAPTPVLWWNRKVVIEFSAYYDHLHLDGWIRPPSCSVKDLENDKASIYFDTTNSKT